MCSSNPARLIFPPTQVLSRARVYGALPTRHRCASAQWAMLPVQLLERPGREAALHYRDVLEAGALEDSGGFIAAQGDLAEGDDFRERGVLSSRTGQTCRTCRTLVSVSDFFGLPVVEEVCAGLFEKQRRRPDAYQLVEIGSRRLCRALYREGLGWVSGQMLTRSQTSGNKAQAPAGWGRGAFRKRASAPRTGYRRGGSRPGRSASKAAFCGSSRKSAPGPRATPGPRNSVTRRPSFSRSATVSS